EIRALVKSVIFSKADLIPDEVNKTLTVKLYSLVTKKDNLAVQNVCELLNDTETIFPGTNMTLVFKTATT
ncbi:MAG: putative transposase, partial [Bacteroidales bacterium]